MVRFAGTCLALQARLASFLATLRVIVFLIIRHLALAVSGGGDSMALAFLCKQLISERLIPDLSAKAFIVDHKARGESTQEAHKVAGWLKDLGRTR
jgi:tRNA(Ile)-lysidine synthase TilS/MesJ